MKNVKLKIKNEGEDGKWGRTSPQPSSPLPRRAERVGKVQGQMTNDQGNPNRQNDEILKPND